MIALAYDLISSRGDQVLPPPALEKLDCISNLAQALNACQNKGVPARRVCIFEEASMQLALHAFEAAIDAAGLQLLVEEVVLQCTEAGCGRWEGSYTSSDNAIRGDPFCCRGVQSAKREEH